MTIIKFDFISQVDGDWICACGNTAIADGFYPVNSRGERVEPTPQAWDVDWYQCDRCGRIIEQDTLIIVAEPKQ